VTDPTPAPTLYDQLAYRTLAKPQTHPDRLATIALLHGMTPRPVDRCRVLELGCGDGSNLVPMAYGLPDSEFVGVDLAGTAVAAGTAAIEALGLRNVTLHHRDIMDLPATLGTFDYIVAHGLYSWVPDAVRDRILAIFHAHLAPHGVAYASYNTYPGCHLRQAVWQVLKFHVHGVDDPTERVAQARALARFLADCPQVDGVDGAALASEMRAVLDHSPGLLFHDDLASINVPVYFHQFVAHAHRHALQFLAEANLHEMQTRAYPPAVDAQLQALADGSVVQREQYLDFVANRRFRQTLLCHEDVVLDRSLEPDVVGRLYVSSGVRPIAEHPDVASPTVVEEFRSPRGGTMSTDYPAAKAVLVHLGRVWPREIRFDALLDEVGVKEAEATAKLRDILLAAYTAGFVELSTLAPHFVLEPGVRPLASPVARLQTQSGAFVTTLRHTSVSIEDDLGRRLLRLLDGTRTREELLEEMRRLVPNPSELTPDGFERTLTQLARFRLLVA
jgi:SAM-dependent methyltransferase